jgi:O-acetyl-ADP-ribose deacetylase (regulator of RNase III)
MRLHLVDSNAHLVNAWSEAFGEFPEVDVRHGDILAVAEHCVVSPARSYGFMDGGIDDSYRVFFGARIERTIQEAVARRTEGNLPVGASIVIRTGHERVPFMIVAPTMTVPEQVDRRHCYRAMRAVLRIAGTNADVGRDVYCPGLAAGIGTVPPEDSAAMMAEAYRDYKNAASHRERSH